MPNDNGTIDDDNKEIDKQQREKEQETLATSASVAVTSKIERKVELQDNSLPHQSVVETSEEKEKSQEEMIMKNQQQQRRNSNCNNQQQQPSSLSSTHSSSIVSSSSSSSSTGAEDGMKMLSSNAEYDHIRNKTLMFFLDRLMIASKDGKEARTLHDLSCLFGTRDFTSEMRQIVGASRNGLKKFLQSYPSLFTIDGDKVYLTQLEQESGASGSGSGGARRGRDYNKEAVDYFTAKLVQFGASLVPIRNLFGYRSQASQEVRHVSGKNTKEFRQFLAANEDSFEILNEEHVVLKSSLKELELKGELKLTTTQQSVDSLGTSNNQSTAAAGGDPASLAAGRSGGGSTVVATATSSSSSTEPTVMDPYLNKRFAHWIEQSMREMLNQEENEQQEDNESKKTNNDNDNIAKKPSTSSSSKKITIEFLHERILRDCQNELFLKMVKTLDELRVFLRMHPKIFKRIRCENDEGVERDYVSLLSEEERRELEMQAYHPNLAHHQHHQLSRQHSTLSSTPTSSSSPAQNQLQLKRCETNESNLSFNDNNHHQPTSLPPQAAKESSLMTNENQEPAAAKRQLTATTSIPSANNSSTTRQLTTKDHHNHNSTSSSFHHHEREPMSLQHHHINVNNMNNSEQQQTRKHQQQQNGGGSGASSLRATAPPFVPSSFQHHQTHNNNNQYKSYRQQPMSVSTSTSSNSSSKPLQRSVSNLNPTLANQQQHRFIDPRQAVRSYLMKASAENAASNTNQQQQQQEFAHHVPHHNNNRNNTNNNPLSRQNSQLSSSNNHNHKDEADELRARTVNIVREASNIIARIMNTTDAVALDCKGYNLGFNGQITMIQFGYLPNTLPQSSLSSKLINSHHHHRQQQHNSNNTNSLPSSTLDPKENGEMKEKNTTPTAGGMPTTTTTTTVSSTTGSSAVASPILKRAKPEVCVFDLITNPELAYCLKPLLESDQVVKIVHDVRNKSNLLYSQFGIMLNHVFDTQVANLVIQQQETGKPAYKSRYISMSRLCEIYGDETLLKYKNIIRTKHSQLTGNGNQHHAAQHQSAGKVVSKDVNYWKTRPLTQAMVLEATVDVYCLVGGVYQNLKSKIKPEYQPLFEQLNLEGVLARIKPDEIRSVKKERKIDLEVIDLKRKLYSDTTSSIVLSNREIRLLRHIDLSDEVRKKIQQCKKVAKKLERLDMKAAQNAQLLQSMNSQTTSNYDGEPSLDPNNESLLTNGSSQSSTQDDHNNNINDKNPNSSSSANDSDRLKLGEKSVDLDALSVTEIGNLMDSSMFDELKDRMFESSSLLESLDEDDYDEVEKRCSNLATDETDANGPTSSIGNHSEHSDPCRCNCHKELSSLKSTASSTSNGSAESKVVDMAIQCDLLS